MNVHTLQFDQVIAKPIQTVYAFFERPENLERITPPQMRFRILTPPPIRMARGALIDYTVRPFLWDVRWSTYIETYDPPHCFVDSQLKGPYAFWHHTHTFEESPAGTHMRDTVRYALPFGILGDTLAGPWVRKQILAIFHFRRQAIERLLSDSRETK